MYQRTTWLVGFLATVLSGAAWTDRAAAQDPFAPRVVLTRWTTAHGRVDEIRSKGVGAGAGVGALLSLIAKQTNPLAISLGLDKDGMFAAGGKPNAIVLAAAALPSGMSLAVAELSPGDSVKWKARVPRFGSGNLYATVSIPAMGIVAGQELHTDAHFKAYTANSVIYEAPDFGNVVVSHALVGGTTHVVAFIGGAQPREFAARVGYSQPLKMELSERRQTRNRVGQVQISLRAELPTSFETTRTIRVAAETRKITVIADVPTKVAPGTKFSDFSVTVPADTEGQVKISAVASPGPFLKALPPAPQSVGLQTFQSTGPTLEDTLTLSVRKLTELAYKGSLTKGDPLDSKRKGCHAKVYPFRMEKDVTYLLDLESFNGSSTPKNPLFFDTYLRIEDASGRELEHNDDGGEGLNARLAFTAPSTGNYRIIVTSYASGATGAYVLRVRY